MTATSQEYTMQNTSRFSATHMKLNLRVLLATKDEMVIICVHHWCVGVKRLRIAILEQVAVQFVWISQDFCGDNRSVTTQSLQSKTLLSTGQHDKTMQSSYILPYCGRHSPVSSILQQCK
jgi:hypothetical protein